MTLAYLADALVGQPDEFDALVRVVANGSSETSPELRASIEALRKLWRERFSDHTPSTEEIVSAALELESKRGRPERLAGIALAWAAENQLWRKQVRNELDTGEVRVLGDLQRAAAKPGL